MRLRSFTGRTMSEAMGQVRQHLGADAIIVATEEDGEGGMRITAALDADTVPSANPAAPDVIDVLGTTLAAHGLSVDQVEHMLSAAFPFEGEKPLDALAGALTALATFRPVEPGQDKRLIFCGPPGAGKTASVAKLAARVALAGDAVRVVSADRARAGGTEQLAAYARILKIPMEVAETPAALAPLMRGGAALTLVDTPGINPFLAEERRELRQLIEASGGEALLVLPAGGDAVDTRETAQAFVDIGCARLVATRLDLARRLGSLVAAAAELRLAYCEAGISGAIAEGLTPFTPVLLARLLLARGAAPEPRGYL